MVCALIAWLVLEFRVRNAYLKKSVQSVKKATYNKKILQEIQSVFLVVRSLLITVEHAQMINVQDAKVISF